MQSPRRPPNFNNINMSVTRHDRDMSLSIENNGMRDFPSQNTEFRIRTPHSRHHTGPIKQLLHRQNTISRYGFCLLARCTRVSDRRYQHSSRPGHYLNNLYEVVTDASSSYWFPKGEVMSTSSRCRSNKSHQFGGGGYLGSSTRRR